MKNIRKILLRYLITTVIGGLLALLVLYLHGYFEATATVERYRILADAFTIPGTILVMVAALIWISSEGMFDGLTYAFGRIGSRLIPFYKGSLKHETYYDYKQSKGNDRPHGYGFLFFVGVAFLAVAVVFICLHAKIYEPMI